MVKRALFLLVCSLVLLSGWGGAAYGEEISSAPVPIYRFYNVSQGVHFFTGNLIEYQNIVSNASLTYRYEGIAFNAYATSVAGSIPVHRFYNYRQGAHFYTTDQTEATNVNDNLWNTFRYEGIAYYAIAADDPAKPDGSVPIHRFYNYRQGFHFYTANQAEATRVNDSLWHTFRYEGIECSLFPPEPIFSGERPAGFIWPAYGEISSSYGYRVHPIFGDIRFHYGLDIAVDYIPLLAPAAGRVISSYWSEAIGNVLEIDHGGGVRTRFLHLLSGSITVRTGDIVTQGQRIATTGNTGYLTTGPHLHFEAYDYTYSNDELVAPYYTYYRGYTFDPLDWLP